MPSAVQRRRERRRSALCWTAAARAVVAFTVRLGGIKQAWAGLLKRKRNREQRMKHGLHVRE